MYCMAYAQTRQNTSLIRGRPSRSRIERLSRRVRGAYKGKRGPQIALQQLPQQPSSNGLWPPLNLPVTCAHQTARTPYTRRFSQKSFVYTSRALGCQSRSRREVLKRTPASHCEWPAPIHSGTNDPPTQLNPYACTQVQYNCDSQRNVGGIVQSIISN